jgi:hypothetical protein
VRVDTGKVSLPTSIPSFEKSLPVSKAVACNEKYTVPERYIHEQRVCSCSNVSSHRNRLPRFVQRLAMQMFATHQLVTTFQVTEHIYDMQRVQSRAIFRNCTLGDVEDALA